jgi:hypothetical protein
MVEPNLGAEQNAKALVGTSTASYPRKEHMTPQKDEATNPALDPLEGRVAPRADPARAGQGRDGRDRASGAAGSGTRPPGQARLSEHPPTPYRHLTTTPPPGTPQLTVNRHLPSGNRACWRLYWCPPSPAIAVFKPHLVPGAPRLAPLWRPQGALNPCVQARSGPGAPTPSWAPPSDVLRSIAAKL